VKVKNEPLLESIVQSWDADSQREVPTAGSIMEVTRPFFEVNTKMQFQISQKDRDWILITHNIDKKGPFDRAELHRIQRRTSLPGETCDSHRSFCWNACIDH
jgi:hypothetical protein